MPGDRRLLLVHAHPDDETINNGATMAHYAAEGAQVTLVTCTLGELGEILVPQLSELEADKGDQLGGYRVLELDRAMTALGVPDHRFLGGPGRFRDSGMMGTSGNDHPRAFWRGATDQAVFAAAVRELVVVIRALSPQVVVTYDANGGYGHPDHIMAHRVTMAAVEAAADPAWPAAGSAEETFVRGNERDGRSAGTEPWSVAKVYWNVAPRAALESGLAALRRAQTGFIVVDSADDFPFLAEDRDVTTVIDASAYTDAKAAAMRAHATQISVAEGFFAVSNHLGLELSGVEHYRIARGAIAGQRDAAGHETDLFAGVAS
jgi:N-acetyl-1-D-myo-inositol-2-amino-2-deoxy-alpha-D-glucopyranoside deacetylase